MSIWFLAFGFTFCFGILAGLVLQEHNLRGRERRLAAGRRRLADDYDEFDERLKLNALRRLKPGHLHRDDLVSVDPRWRRPSSKLPAPERQVDSND